MSVVPLLLLAGCASTWSGAPAACDGIELSPVFLPTAEPGVPDTTGLPHAPAVRGTLTERDAVPASLSRRVSLSDAGDPLFHDRSLVDGPRQAAPETGLRENRFTIKGGYYDSSEDSLEDGYIINGAWTRFLNKWLAVEFELGYLDADGDVGPVETEVWAIPLMLNGRANIPLWILDVYGGAGIGTLYYDAEASAGPFRATADGWLLAGNVFAGTSLNVADRVALGLEVKYYLTDEISNSNEGLDALAVMLTLGWSL
jgi:opacity protein-like surface antigen